MTDRCHRIGIVGLTPGRSWAARAHLPALRELADLYAVVGVANSTPDSARDAARASGIAHAYPGVEALVSSPAIDIVTVTVKVPHHATIVAAALAAGKHVYCEWPLAAGLAEARMLADQARQWGVVAVVGTQARVAPAIAYARDLIADGYLGEVLSTTVIGSGRLWGATIEGPRSAYLLDPRYGATMLTIPLGHMLAALTDILGPIAELSAHLATRRPAVTERETGVTLPMSAADQVAVAGTLGSGAAVAIHYRGGLPRGTGLLWEINGSKGDLQISGANGHAQMVALTMKGGRGDDAALRTLTIPERYGGDDGLGPVVGNVKRLYQRMAADLRDGTRTAPRFDDAVTVHQQIAAIVEAARSGRRVRPDTL